jgi:hypothetical protein
MRRILTAAALGIFWANVAPAQEPIADDKDTDPPLLYDNHPVEITHFDWGGPPDLQARRAKWLKSLAPGLFWGSGKNFDGSCLGEVMRAKSHLNWDFLRGPSCLDRYEPPIYQPEESCLEVLYLLCFFDALSPAEVGLEIGPLFKRPVADDNCRIGHALLR